MVGLGDKEELSQEEVDRIIEEFKEENKKNRYVG